MPVLEEAVIIKKTFECALPVCDFWIHPSGAFAVVDSVFKLQAFDCYSLGLIDEFEKLRVWKQKGQHILIFSERLDRFYASDSSHLYKADLCKAYPSKLEEVRRLNFFSKKSFVIEDYDLLIRCSKSNIHLLSFTRETSLILFQESPGREFVDFHVLYRSSSRHSKRIIVIDGNEVSVVALSSALELRQLSKLKEERLDVIVQTAVSPDESFIALQDKTNCITLYKLEPSVSFFKSIKAEDPLVSLTMAMFTLELFEEPQPCLCFMQERTLVIKSEQFQVRRVRKLQQPINRIFYSRVMDDMLLMLSSDGHLSALWLRVAPEWSRLCYRLVPIDKMVVHEERQNEFEDEPKKKQGTLAGLDSYSDCIWSQQSLRDLYAQQNYLPMRF